MRHTVVLWRRLALDKLHGGTEIWRTNEVNGIGIIVAVLPGAPKNDLIKIHVRNVVQLFDQTGLVFPVVRLTETKTPPASMAVLQ
jgi:hypothetical protein